MFRFLFPVLPVTINLYLPLELSVTIVIGGVIRWIPDRKMRKQGRMESRGMLFGSGMIAGERLADILRRAAYKRLMRALVTGIKNKHSPISASGEVDYRDPLANDGGAVPWEKNRSHYLRTGRSPQNLFFRALRASFVFGNMVS